MGRLEGRVAIVTGGATGIGRSIAERFLAEGARVAVGQLGAASNSPPPGGEMFELDVRDAADVQSFVAKIVESFGRVDVAVSSAAITGPAAFAPLLEHSADLFEDVLSTNLTGPFLVTQAAARAMIDQGEGGRIINIASVDAFVAEEFAAGYVAAKAGLVGLTRACAVELAAHRITVNAIAPGQIFSEAGIEAVELRGSSDTPPYRFYREAPLGPGGAPEDVAGTAAFLASDDARWITGATLVVDGGFLAV
jgi:3-oxoacyl-[acyl-carrier protein] reductase